MGEDDKVHQIAITLANYIIAKIIYKIHDKEFLAIVDFLQHWGHFLEGIAHVVIVYTYHENLDYFILFCVLNWRQTRWNMSLSRFDFVIIYRSKKHKGLFDALLRISYFGSKTREPTFDQHCRTLLKP